MLVPAGSQIRRVDLQKGLKHKIKTAEAPKTIMHVLGRLAVVKGDSKEFNEQPYGQVPLVSAPISGGVYSASLNSLAL
jgi:hypothetical protein